MAAARHQIDEADFVDLAQIHLVEDRAGRDGAVDVEPHPAHVAEGELGEQPVAHGAVGVIADQPGAVGQLHDRPDLMEARHLGVPAETREPGQIGVVRLVLAARRRRASCTCPSRCESDSARRRRRR